ncbi:WD repeat and SOCS box-containing protein 1 isoform 2-T2 [Spinachia spinachia]
MASFPDSVNENYIGKAKFIGELLVPVAPFDQKSGREAWTVAFAPNGSYFAWSQGHRIVRLIPWAKCLKNFLIGHGGETTNALSPPYLSRQNSREGQVIPEADEPREHTIDCGDVVWGLAFGSSVPEKQSRCVNIEWHRFKFGQDQLLLATGLSNGRIKIWDVYTGNMVTVLRGHQNWVYCSAFSPDSSILCSVGAGKAVLLWNMDKLTMMRKLEGHHNDVVSCEFSPDGALLATASYDTRVIVWDPHKATVLLELGHLFPPPSPIFAGGANDRWVRSVSFSPDGRHIASITDDRLVRFWSIEERAPQAIGSLSSGLCCAFSAEGSVLAAGTRDGSVHFWECPRSVPSLQHISRMSLRRVMTSQQVETLAIPIPLHNFLTYKVI